MKKFLMVAALAATGAVSAQDSVHIVKNGVTTQFGTSYGVTNGQRIEVNINRTSDCTHGLCGFSYDRKTTRDNYRVYDNAAEFTSGTFSVPSHALHASRKTGKSFHAVSPWTRMDTGQTLSILHGLSSVTVLKSLVSNFFLLTLICESDLMETDIEVGTGHLAIEGTVALGS